MSFSSILMNSGSAQSPPPHLKGIENATGHTTCEELSSSPEARKQPWARFCGMEEGR